MYLESKDFRNLVLHSPLISLDLCILKDRKILLGKRKNNPAKDFYFVPGGRIRKNEKIDLALNRILIEELGYQFKLKKIKKEFLGYYEHFYEENFLGNDDFDTHYVVLTFLIKYEDLIKVLNIPIESDQHCNYLWYNLEDEKPKDIEIHKYSFLYIKSLI